MTRFRRTDVNVIQCADGYTVMVQGRTGLRYVEGDSTLSIDSEMLSGCKGIVVFCDGIWVGNRVGAANKRASIEPVERTRIINNVVAALIFDGFRVELN